MFRLRGALSTFLTCVFQVPGNTTISFFRDPKIIFQIVAILVTIIAFYLNQRRQRRALTYYLSFVSLTSIRKGYESKIEMRVSGNPAPNPTLVLLEITNTGRTAIKPDDFVDPLRLILSPMANVLAVEVSKQIPSDLNAKLVLDTGDDPNELNSVTLSPLLLNSGDSLRAEILASNVDRTRLRVQARIVDIPKLKRAKAPQSDEGDHISDQYRWSWMRFLYGCAGAGAVEVLRFYKAFSPGIPALPILLFVLISLSVIGLGGTLASAWGDNNRIKCLFVGSIFPIWISGWAFHL